MNAYVYGDKALRWSRRLSFVPRWVIVPTIRHQSVAEHSFHVARTVLWLLGRMSPERREALYGPCLLHALSHDDTEAATGDIPSPSKTRPMEKGDTCDDILLMNDILLVNKVADWLEALAFIQEEETLGNRFNLDHIKEHINDKLRSRWLEFSGLLDESFVCVSWSDLVRDYLGQIVSTHPGMES